MFGFGYRELTSSGNSSAPYLVSDGETRFVFAESEIVINGAIVCKNS